MAETETEGIAESEFEMEFDEATSVLAWQYDTSLYSEATIASMAGVMHRLLAHCAALPNAPLPARSADSPQFEEVLATALPPADEVRQRVTQWQEKLGSVLQETEEGL